MNIIIKVPWPKIGDSAFAAFPWNVHLLATYETIFKSLKKCAEYKALAFKYGSKVLPSQGSSLGVAEFINRNKQMYDIFVEGIESSDIFIADITGQNPNVMLELGIAMKLNKNILILREKGKKEKYPFDIQSVHIQEYGSIAELETIIAKFIRMFLKIRNQTFDNPISERYTKIDKIELETGPKGAVLNTDQRLPRNIKNFMMKFGFQFLDHVSKRDWIGVHLRTQGPGRDNSQLLYSRVNDQLESIPWPTNDSPVKATNIQSSGDSRFEISLIENRLDVKTKSKILDNHNIFASGFGAIAFYLQAHTPEPELKDRRLKVECINIEIVNLDTTSNL